MPCRRCTPGGVELIITDLMQPGESGIGLVQRLLQEPVQGHRIPVAVFSAGLTPPVREQLQAMKVWRMVSKPASVAEREACVTDALALVAEPPANAPATSTTLADEAADDEAQAIASRFAGEEFLFKAYRASCLQQFPADIRQGDAACTAQDWPALRRLAHSLATVLLTLGHPARACAPASWKTGPPSPPPRHAWNIGACCGRFSCSSDPGPAALRAHRVASQRSGSGRSSTQPPPPENTHPIGGRHHFSPK